jgi:hypothetical protein
MKQNEMDIADVLRVITTCCSLHNVYIHGDTFVETWLEVPQLQQPNSVNTLVVSCSQSKDIRDTLVQNFSTL